MFKDCIEDCSVIKLILSQFVLYTVTLDYKGLVLLMAKIDDEDFQLGGQGLAIEFCIFCLALRVSFLIAHVILKYPNIRMCLEISCETVVVLPVNVSMFVIKRVV